MHLPAPTLATLRAALDRLIPADEFPSATEAGVLDYMERQLRGPLAAELPLIARGLEALEREALARAGVAFAQLRPEEQDGLLQEAETGKPRERWSVDPAEFFERLLNLTAEGYYADPGNGGNRDRVSWNMLGYDPKLPDRITAP